MKMKRFWSFTGRKNYIISRLEGKGGETHWLAASTNQEVSYVLRPNAFIYFSQSPYKFHFTGELEDQSSLPNVTELISMWENPSFLTTSVW